MNIPHETSLIVKAVWSAAIVLGLSAVAERVGTRVAGILAGAPLNAVLVYLFVGLDMGPGYVVASTPHGVAAFTGTLAFVLAWQRTSLRFGRQGAAASAVVALVVFLAVARALEPVPFGLAGATALTVCAAALSVWLFRRIEFLRVERPVRYTFRLLALRAGMAAVLVVGVISAAEALGPRWTGLLAGFPATLLPTLLIIHATYGPAHAQAVIRGIPVGIGSIVLFILGVSLTFPRLGVYGGTAASLAISFVYLTAVMYLAPSRRRTADPAATRRDPAR